jgi:cell division inhibitor SepF
MAGTMRKMATYLGLVEDDAELYDDEYTDEYDDRDTRQDAQHARPETRHTARVEAPRAETSRFERADLGEARSAPARVAAPVAARPVAAVRDDRLVSAGRRPSNGSTALVEPEVDSYRITTLHPRNYNDARTVGEYYRDSIPVIMNLTDMEDADAKRLVDFAAGLVFALHGTLERVTNKVFLLSPANVTVTAEEKARLAEGGFFNQS